MAAPKKQDKDDEKAKEAAAPKKKGGLFKILIIVLAVILLASGGVVGYLVFFADSPIEQANNSAPQAQPAAEPIAMPNNNAAREAGVMFDFAPFVVNLAEPAGSRYLRVSLSAEIPKANGDKIQLEVEQKLPKIKDAIITVISSKTYEEVTTPQGKISLKQELLRRINSNLASGRLVDIYITEFVVQ